MVDIDEGKPGYGGSGDHPFVIVSPDDGDHYGIFLNNTYAKMLSVYSNTEKTKIYL